MVAEGAVVERVDGLGHVATVFAEPLYNFK